MHNISMFKGGKADLWFVLTAENLMWFKDEEVCILLLHVDFTLQFLSLVFIEAACFNFLTNPSVVCHFRLRERMVVRPEKDAIAQSCSLEMIPF